MSIFRVSLFVLLLVVSTHAQTPAPVQPGAQEHEPALPNDLRLERENLLLQARVNELETQLAALRAQFISERIGQRAPALIQRLQAAAPEWDVNPQTLALTRKAAAGVVPPMPNSSAPPTPQPER